MNNALFTLAGWHAYTLSRQAEHSLCCRSDMNGALIMNRPVILCGGGDARYIFACRELCSFAKVYSYGLDGALGETIALNSLDDMRQKADILLLPMLAGSGLDIPCACAERLSCDKLSGHLEKNALVLGGRLSTDVIEYFSSLGFDVMDYFTREELVIKNCVPTAEGALEIVLRELAVTVNGTKTLIIGYGRVAKACAKLFDAVGSDVTVCARKLSQLAMAENDGCRALLLGRLADEAGDFDIVINTVPALVLTKQVLERAQKDCLIIDLASKPGGTDFEAAKLLGHKAIHALALPGKTARESAGKIIAEAVRNIYNERRETDVFRGH